MPGIGERLAAARYAFAIYMERHNGQQGGGMAQEAVQRRAQQQIDYRVEDFPGVRLAPSAPCW
jgi:hypothetical protein